MKNEYCRGSFKCFEILFRNVNQSTYNTTVVSLDCEKSVVLSDKVNYEFHILFSKNQLC